MSKFTDILGIGPPKSPEVKPEYAPPSKTTPKRTVQHTPAQPRNLKKEILAMFPTVTELKNYLLAKGDKISADEWKTLGRITKEAIHIDRIIATIKEMIMNA